MKYLIIILIALFLTSCEFPTSSNRDKEQKELRDNDGLRNG